MCTYKRANKNVHCFSPKLLPIDTRTLMFNVVTALFTLHDLLSNITRVHQDDLHDHFNDC